MVDSRCAMTSVVRPSDSSSSDAWMARSLSLSSALVASSRMRMRGLRKNTRAMAIRCFCPPDSRAPRSPTNVS